MAFPSTSRPVFNGAVAALKTPPIPLVQHWADGYDNAHGPLIDLSQAVPGYPPHPDLLSGLARNAADCALTGYGPIEGEDALRAAVARAWNAELGSQLKPDNVQITAGCNQAFVIAMMTLAGAGDGVLLTNPCFFNHTSAIEMLGIVPHFVTCSEANSFIPDPDAIAKCLDDYGCKVVALVTPNNPTGAIYPSDILQRIQEICAVRGVWLVIDETYSDFIADRASPRHALLTSPGWEENTVLLYSFSKAYCIPGQRVGALTAGADVVEQTTKVMDNLQICAPRHAQATLAEAIDALSNWRADNREEIARRGAVFKDVIADQPDWSTAAMGAYFAYVRHPFPEMSSMAVAERLAHQAGVLCLPGDFFGSEQGRFLRMAFANADTSVIARLADRLPLLT